MEDNYLDLNRETWNKKTDVHYTSEFYDVEGFLKGNTSLKEIELNLLKDLSGKSVLHLQCHFGQDTISLERLGASVTGIDISDNAIKHAKKLAKDANSNATFICTDLYNLPNVLDKKFDLVFTSYGTIGWLPDLDKWANVIAHFLKPEGNFVFAEFHPVVWMFDDDFRFIKYKYFNDGPIIETYTGTYTDQNAPIEQKSVTWNHSISSVVTNLIQHGFIIDALQEFDFSPYPCFSHVEEFALGKYRIKHLINKIPMVYAISATKK